MATRLEVSAADASEVAVFNADANANAAAAANQGGAQAPAIPVPQSGNIPAAPGSAAPDAPGTPSPEASPTAVAATEKTPEPAPKRNKGGNGNYISRAAQEGYDVHDFVEHTVELLGTQAMEPGQSRTGGFQRLGDYEIRAWSPITGQRPVIEQAIDDVRERNPDATGQELERRVAKRLTELNDWKNLNDQTKQNMMILTGVDIANMDKRQREDTINHLLHSPLPFGYIEDLLTPDTTIDMGYTHTLDKDWTEAAHLGDGVFQILMISNNNNGSHTGHVLGSFKVQLTPTTTLAEARDIGNGMVKNKNKNNKLYLAEAARRVLYGETPRLDFSDLSEEERRAIYEGRGLGDPGAIPPAPTEPDTADEPATTDTTAPDGSDPAPQDTAPSSTVSEPESESSEPETTETTESVSATEPETPPAEESDNPPDGDQSGG